MRNEALILNIICIALAGLFLGIVVISLINAGNIVNILTIDTLFLTTVFTLLALVLLINPLMSLKERGILRNPLKRDSAATAPASLSGAGVATPQALSAGDTAAARPALSGAQRTKRQYPPDVELILAKMKGSQEKSSTTD
ncbi:MAG TPA: hypothetical protein VD966_12995 [Pyrinomonadaceae bacterium]|nr:hypothetical protein [Pyrinomonadaceae bacterium]